MRRRKTWSTVSLGLRDDVIRSRRFEQGFAERVESIPA